MIHSGYGVTTIRCNASNLLNSNCLFCLVALIFSYQTIKADDCDSNGVPDSIDIMQGGKNDCNQNKVLDACEIAHATNDCNKNNIPDECDAFPKLVLSEPIAVLLPMRISNAVVADLNGDALSDFFVLSADKEKESGKHFISMMINKGQLTFEESARVSIESEQSKLLAKDITGDQVMDLVIATSNGPIVCLINNGSGNSWERLIIDNGPCDIGVIRGDDLNNDGLAEVVTVGAWVVNVYFNQALSFSKRTFDISSFCATTPAIGDIDNDGDNDILVSNDGCIRNDYDIIGGMPVVLFLENTGRGELVGKFIRFSGPVLGPFLADVDADGASDIVVSRGVFFNEGDMRFGAFVPHQCGVFAAVIDMEGDGDQDFIGGQIACICRNPREFTRRSLLSFNVILTGDMDGDSVNDIGSFDIGIPKLFIRLNHSEPPYYDRDQDGRLDSCVPSFVRGDCTGDIKIDITDALCTLNFLFAGKNIACEKSADTDENGQVTVTDAILILRVLFVGWMGPGIFNLECSVDGNIDSLTCAAGHLCTPQ